MTEIEMKCWIWLFARLLDWSADSGGDQSDYALAGPAK